MSLDLVLFYVMAMPSLIRKHGLRVGNVLVQRQCMYVQR